AFPAFGAIPFLVIAGIAAWKQRGKPSAARVEQTAATLAALPWPAFADVLEAALRRDGCEVTRLDGKAADFALTRAGGARALLAARRWKARSEEHTSELQSRENLVCRLLLEKKKQIS